MQACGVELWHVLFLQVGFLCKASSLFVMCTTNLHNFGFLALGFRVQIKLCPFWSKFGRVILGVQA